MRKKLITLVALMAMGGLGVFAQTIKTLRLVETTDVHGCFFGYDFMKDQKVDNGLDRVAAYVRGQRAQRGEEHVMLVDAGDVLQGQPCVYYANFVDKELPAHIASDVYNYMRYDVGAFGNHDIEATPPVYRRWMKDCKFPVLGANIIDDATGKPFAQPYCMIKKDGMRIAVIGMLTPAIPMWLPEKMWQGLSFRDIEQETAAWIKKIKRKEHPDLVIGLFHSGFDAPRMNGYKEDATKSVAENIPGFDIICCGHDHRPIVETVRNKKTGRDVWILNSGARAHNVAQADIDYVKTGRKVIIKSIKGELVSLKSVEPDKEFTARYAGFVDTVRKFVAAPVGRMATPVHGSDYFFGNSEFADLIHGTQFRQVEADISLVTPLSADLIIEAGELTMRDAFRLYRFENMIDVIEMSGKEIRGALEKSYDNWIHNPAADGHVVKMKQRKGRMQLEGFHFLMVSAAGVSYDVDVTKPLGQRLIMKNMKDGSKFDEDKTYRVAVNSYIGSGGGAILTEGAGISREELTKRVVDTTPLDLRHYLIEYLGTLNPSQGLPRYSHWQFIPVDIVKPLIVKDRKILF